MLPTFSGDEPVCPKCGHQGADTEYRDHGSCVHPGGLVAGVHPHERLHRECLRCGYAWDEATLQQRPIEEAEPQPFGFGQDQPSSRSE